GEDPDADVRPADRRQGEGRLRDRPGLLVGGAGGADRRGDVAQRPARARLLPDRRRAAQLGRARGDAGLADRGGLGGGGGGGGRGARGGGARRAAGRVAGAGRRRPPGGARAVGEAGHADPTLTRLRAARTSESSRRRGTWPSASARSPTIRAWSRSGRG